MRTLYNVSFLVFLCSLTVMGPFLLGLDKAAAQYYPDGWDGTQAFSDDDRTGDTPTRICPGGINGLACEGDYCKNITLSCASGVVTSNNETGKASPRIESKNRRREKYICNKGMLAVGMSCTGKSCGEIVLYCAKPAGLVRGSCDWTNEFVSEERDSKIDEGPVVGFIFKPNRYLAGMHCVGNRCDNKRLFFVIMTKSKRKWLQRSGRGQAFARVARIVQVKSSNH